MLVISYKQRTISPALSFLENFKKDLAFDTEVAVYKFVFQNFKLTSGVYEISQRETLRLDNTPFAWLVLKLINTWFSDLTDTWISTDPQMLELSENSQHCFAKVWDRQSSISVSDRLYDYFPPSVAVSQIFSGSVK